MRKTAGQIPKDKNIASVNAGILEFSRYAYADANTDRITEACGISKGLLYHYFGTKKGFYLFCLRHAIEMLTEPESGPEEGDFYGILFSAMEKKIKLCAKYPAETKFLNMASRESSAEVKPEKDALFAHYAVQLRASSEGVLDKAVSTLNLRTGLRGGLASQCLTVYINALISRYLLLYQYEPEQFFQQKETIMKELRQDIDLMLHGICEEGK